MCTRSTSWVCERWRGGERLQVSFTTVISVTRASVMALCTARDEARQSKLPSRRRQLGIHPPPRSTVVGFTADNQKPKWGSGASVPHSAPSAPPLSPTWSAGALSALRGRPGRHTGQPSGEVGANVNVDVQWSG